MEAVLAHVHEAAHVVDAEGRVALGARGAEIARRLGFGGRSRRTGNRRCRHHRTKGHAHPLVVAVLRFGVAHPLAADSVEGVADAGRALVVELTLRSIRKLGSADALVVATAVGAVVLAAEAVATETGGAVVVELAGQAVLLARQTETLEPEDIAAARGRAGHVAAEPVDAEAGTQLPLLPQSESLTHVRVGSSRQTLEQSPGTEHATGVSTRWQVPSRLGTSQRSFPSQIVAQQYPSMQRDDEHSSPNRHAVPFAASPGVETFTKACSWRSRLDETAMSIGPSP